MYVHHNTMSHMYMYIIIHGELMPVGYLHVASARPKDHFHALQMKINFGIFNVGWVTIHANPIKIIL